VWVIEAFFFFIMPATTLGIVDSLGLCCCCVLPPAPLAPGSSRLTGENRKNGKTKNDLYDANAKKKKKKRKKWLKRKNDIANSRFLFSDFF